MLKCEFIEVNDYPGNQMTFFENLRNLEREKEENQYPKDVHTQWDLKYNIQNR